MPIWLSIAALLQTSQEWSPKARVKDCLVNQDQASDDGGGSHVRVRVDLFSAHVLSEFVVDMSPATNAAAAATTASAAGNYPTWKRESHKMPPP